VDRDHHLLEINDIDIGQGPPIQADAFVRAVAVDHTWGVKEPAEWFENVHLTRRPGASQHPKVEYMFLARAASSHDRDGTISLLSGGLAGGSVVRLPVFITMALVARVHWHTSDVGQSHKLEVIFRCEDPSVEVDGQARGSPCFRLPDPAVTRITMPA